MITEEIFRSVSEWTSPTALARGVELVRSVQLMDRYTVDDEIGLMYRIGAVRTEVFVDKSTREVIDVDCSCRRHACEHAAAILLHIAGVSAGLPREPAGWERELSGLVDPVPTPTAETCLFLKYDAPRGSKARIVARPGERGARGDWIFGRADWTHIGEGRGITGELLAEIEDAAAPRVWGYYPSSTEKWISLAEVSWHRLWQTLTELRAHGTPILSGGKKQLPIIFAEGEIAPDVHLVRHGSGLRMEAQLPDIDNPLWVGSPAQAVAQVANAAQAHEQITLQKLSRPLDRTMTALLSREAALTIPADDVGRFVEEYLPRLQIRADVRSPNGSFEVPEAPRPALVLTLSYEEKRTYLSWAWRRPGGISDPDAERATVRQVREAFRDHAEPLTGTGSAPVSRALELAHAAIFGAEILPRLREVSGLRIVEEQEGPAYRAADAAPVVSISAADDGIDWFDLSVTVSVDGEPVDFASLFRALSAGDPVLVLPSGTFFPLDTPELDRLRALIEEARALGDKAGADGIRISRYQVDFWEELRELGVIAEQEQAWHGQVSSLARGEVLERLEPPTGLQATLRDYQHAGYSWLSFLLDRGLGGVLADDMGLGKTLQMIAAILGATERDPEAKPFLIVAPTSVVPNWAAECRKFAPELTVAQVTATEKRRGTPLADHIAGADVVVTSYTLFNLELDEYREREWSALVLDEAQLVKNPASRGYAAARKLGAASVFVLTGTPLENHLLELWALVSLACPGLLSGRTSFTEFYRKPIEKEKDAEKLQTLQRRIRPFLMRRTKELVATELPARQEQVQEIALHPEHRRIYDRRLARERQKVLGLLEDAEANRFQIFRSLTTLRQLALDAELTGEDGSAPSAKLDAFADLLAEATDEGHRVLVFSQFTSFLGKARDRAAQLGIPLAYLDGSTRDRGDVVERFRTGDAQVFFISLKAGGFGLNLVEADYVVLLDPWWNPAAEQQAIDRAHRIGQDKPVFVYRMISADTIEAKVMALKKTKSELFSRVLDGGALAEQGALSTDDIRALLD